MHFESGECATEGCVNQHPLDNVTMRMSTDVQRVEFMEVGQNFAGVTQCQTEGGSPSNFNQAVTTFYCFKDLPFETDLINWDINDFKIYRLLTNGAPPPFFAGPGIFNGNEYPNTVPNTNSQRTVAAAVDCRGMPSAAPLRWSMDRSQNGPCFVDTEYGITLCSPSGKSLNNPDYRDINNNVMPSDTVFKDVFCPT